VRKTGTDPIFLRAALSSGKWGLSLFFCAALAQPYPVRPVTFIVPFPPGGGTDISARTVAAKLTDKWGKSVVVENRGGAAGILGADAVARARPDGYTLLIANVGLMASPSFPSNSVKELVAYAKANPEKVTFASSGQGGSPHLTAEIFQLATGTKQTHLPYKGGGPAMTDLMAGHVDLLFASVLEGSGHIKAGKLKGLAVTHGKRSPAIPDVPTVAEAGVKGAESGHGSRCSRRRGPLQRLFKRFQWISKKPWALPTRARS
jgi:tripartite-type tricarboxylate transporter receptor subunit TctC